MTTPPIGDNRTGIATAPERAAAMREGTAEFLPTSAGDAHDAVAAHAREARGAPSIGSLPRPRQDAGIAFDDPAHAELLDRMGERLAFERTGARLYEGVIAKLEANGGFRGGPTREDLEDIRAEELSHFRLLQNCIQELGGDPTAVTPAADVATVASSGVGQVIADPRTDLTQSLHALLVAELTDAASWDLLIAIADRAGQQRLIPAFRTADQREQQHVERLRSWLQAAAGVA